MSKALEILTNLLKQKYDDRPFVFGVEKAHIEIDNIHEAIAEIEEAMETKTCKLCAYCEPFNSVCFNDKSPLCADFVNSEYGCIYWERKATT